MTKQEEMEVLGMVSNARIIAASGERMRLVSFITDNADRFAFMSGPQVGMEVLKWVRSRHGRDAGATPQGTHDGHTEPMEMDPADFRKEGRPTVVVQPLSMQQIVDGKAS
jgi:hypothetical protein